MMADPVMGGSPGPDLVLETRAGRLPTRRVSDLVFTVDMGPPAHAWSEIPLAEPFPDTREIAVKTRLPEAPELRHPSAVGMGNPHAIFFVADPEAYDLRRIGPLLEHDPVFPDRANISLARVADPGRIVLRVWERGAGLTRACGSAACAAVVAAARKGLTGRDATVSLPGGDLHIAWRPEDDHVLMTGPVAFEHEGRLAPALFAGAA
jgi:diaminopimelate epimerase